MLKAVAVARERGGIGLWFPSPSEYNSAAFLGALTDTFANEIDQRYRRDRATRYVALGVERWLALGLAAIGLTVGLVVFSVSSGGFSTSVSTALVGGLVSVVAALAAAALPRVRAASTAEGRLILEARDLRQRIRFSLTRREAAELGAQTGGSFGAKFTSSRQRELVERPVTLSTLIHDFRELARQAGETADPVIIAIDELDKMSGPDKVRDLLRDIKGIFEVPGVHFLVSVSYEAMRSLRLGAVTGRDEFNSSFYTVIELPPITPQECELLLWRRRVLSLRFDENREEFKPVLIADHDAEPSRQEALQKLAGGPVDIDYFPKVGLVLGVLTGGIPREVVRLADSLERGESDGCDRVKRAIVGTLGSETREFRRQLALAVERRTARARVFHGCGRRAANVGRRRAGGRRIHGRTGGRRSRSLPDVFR
jgi:hypothetical protein